MDEMRHSINVIIKRVEPSRFLFSLVSPIIRFRLNGFEDVTISITPKTHPYLSQQTTCYFSLSPEKKTAGQKWMMTFFFSDDNHSNKSTFFPEKFAIEHLWSNLNQWVEISRIFSSSTPQVSPRIHFLLLMKEHPEPPPKPIKFEVKETQTTQQTSNSTTETMPVKRKVRRLPPAPPRPSNIRWVPSPGKTTPSGLDLHLTGRLTPKQMHELSVTHKFDKYDRTLDSTRKSRTST